MALRLGFKINRIFRLYKSKFPNSDHIKTFSCQNSKLRYTKSGCTLTPNQVERRLRNNNVEQTSIPISTRNSFKLTQQGNLNPDGYDVNEIPVIPSELQNTSVNIRRKFAKSSTQNAITQPLKIPRLANPFPEPVKTLPSDTVSDEEKSRQMQEQVKMEARYHLQMHQEMLLQQKLQKMSQKQNVHLNNNKVNQQPQINHQQMNYSFHEPQQINTQVQPLQQPHFRKPKQYADLHQEESSMANHQQCKKSPKEYAINTTVQNADDIKQKRPRNARCRRKAHTRAARYLRHSWYPRGYIRRQMREYSTSVNSPAIYPTILSVSEECDTIMKRLKSLYPKYENLEKPVLIPGSPEEKEFLEHILRLIGKLKLESDKPRPTAPFPSYSEVKTYKSEPRKTNNIIFSPGSYPRYYSTRKGKNKLQLLVQNSTKNKCPKFKLQGINCNQNSSPKKNIPVKQEAPYPAYSEICEDPYESDPNEGKICALRPDVRSITFRTQNKYFSTSAGDSKNVDKKEAKKKPPCKSPYPPIPQCDYEKQAEKNAEKKRKKHCPKEKKKCKADSTRIVDSRKIISKIKSWLSVYKPDKDNIKVSRSPNDIDGRETYVIDVCEYQEITPKEAELDLAAKSGGKQSTPEIIEIYQDSQDVLGARRKLFNNVVYQPFKYEDSHALEMTDPIPVYARNIPDFITQSSINFVPESHSEELKQIDENVTKLIPFKIPDLKLTETDFKPKEDKINNIKENIEVKPFESNLKKVKIPNEFDVNKFKQTIEVKPILSNINTGIIPKKLNTNKVKEVVAAKPNRVNIVRQFKTKHSINEDKKNVKVRANFKSSTENAKLKPIDYKSLKIHQNISKYTEFKVNDMPEPCPIVKSRAPGLCSPNPGCKEIKGGCAKKKKKEQPKKKCRFKKKRKLPNCDDVKKNKKKTCFPLSIPGLEGKPEYAMNAPKKTYFKKSDNISNFIDVEEEDISVLANQKPKQEKEFVPFKLKTEFWKK